VELIGGYDYKYCTPQVFKTREVKVRRITIQQCGVGCAISNEEYLDRLV